MSRVRSLQADSWSVDTRRRGRLHADRHAVRGRADRPALDAGDSRPDARARRGAGRFGARHAARRQQRAVELRDHVRPRLLLAGPSDAWRARRPAATEAFLPPEMATGPRSSRAATTSAWRARRSPARRRRATGSAAGQASPGYAVVARSARSVAGTARFFGTNSDGVIYEHTATLRRRCRRSAARRPARRSSSRLSRSRFAQRFGAAMASARVLTSPAC